MQVCEGVRMQIEREEKDDLDEAILARIAREGAPVQRIAMDIGRAYSTVLLRCLKLQASGLLRSSWYGNVRKFYAVEN